MFFFVLCFFLHKNTTKQHDFNTFRKLRERPKIIVLWEIWPKKEGAYSKKEIGTDRLQKDYKSQIYTTKLINGLEKTIKDYKVYQ